MKNLQKTLALERLQRERERERMLMNPSIKINLGKVNRSISKNTKHKPSSKADYNKLETKTILVTGDNSQ